MSDVTTAAELDALREQIESVLFAHQNVPVYEHEDDPSLPRFRCAGCGLPINGGPNSPDHVRHVATAVVPLLAEARAEGAREALLSAAEHLRDEDQDGRDEWYVEWLRARAAQIAMTADLASAEQVKP